MSHVFTRGRQAVLAPLILLACIGLAACGSSSSSTTSQSANAASSGAAASGTSSTGSTSPPPGGPGAARGSARFTALRECLQKNGITLPKRTHGARPGGGFVPGAGGSPQLPSGVTRAQYEAALKKCGGNGHFARVGAAGRLNNPVFKAALTKYGDCLRQNGIKLPAANTSGNGPIFDTKGIDTAGPQFKAASAKCRSVLIGAFRRRAGAPGAAGAPPPPSESTTG